MKAISHVLLTLAGVVLPNSIETRSADQEVVVVNKRMDQKALRAMAGTLLGPRLLLSELAN